MRGLRLVLHAMCVICVVYMILIETDVLSVGPDRNLLRVTKPEVQEYCLSKGIDFDKIDSPRLCREDGFDFCVQYEMQSDDGTNHVLRFVFREGWIVKRDFSSSKR